MITEEKVVEIVSAYESILKKKDGALEIAEGLVRDDPRQSILVTHFKEMRKLNVEFDAEREIKT